MNIVKGRTIAKITGATVVSKQIEVLQREGFTFWLDVKGHPRMYEGQLPEKNVKKSPTSEFKLPDVQK